MDDSCLDDDGWMMGDVGWWHDESQWSWPKKTIGDNMRGTSLSPNVGKGKFGRLVAETQQMLQVCGPYTMKVEVANM